MPNICFKYVYRDADNYKIFGDVVFSNKEGLKPSVIAASIKRALIDGQFFYPSKWNLPLLNSDEGFCMEETDWCELEGIEEVNCPSTHGTISELLRRVAS